MDEWKAMADAVEYQDASLLEEKRILIDSIQQKIDHLTYKKTGIQSTADIAESNYENEQQSFDNWIEARMTVGSPNEDKEVISRAKKLDEYYTITQEWRSQLAEIEHNISELYNQQQKIEEQVSEEQNRAQEVWRDEFESYNLQIFLIRLAIILPLLLIGIYLVLKLRQHKFWPLFQGYVFFSLYAFFFGLVPYLPSYGGYVRYTVGIVLSIFVGIYAINKIRAFIERKQNELKESSEDRAKNVKSEVAEKALDSHMCPSCGKDFIVKKWGMAKNLKLTADNFLSVTNFCRYCGLELFKKCANCGTENYAHLPFCSSCGDEVMKD